MAQHPAFAATVMLDSLRSLDTDDLKDLLEAYMESPGSVQIAQGQVQAGDFGFRIGIDGAHVNAVFSDTRFRPHEWSDGLAQCQAMDAEPVLALHRANVRVSRVSRQSGLSALKANATLVSIVAAGIGMQLSARGMLFEDSGAVHDAVSARRAGLTAIRGVSPIEAWVGVCPISIDSRGAPGTQGTGMHGAVSRGLLGLIGREIEIAPAPIAASDAVRRLEGMAWRALDGGLSLREGEEVSPAGDSDVRLTVHEANAWLRPGVPAFVLVAPDAAIEQGTLVPKAGFGPARTAVGTGVRRAAPADLMERVSRTLGDRDTLKATGRAGAANVARLLGRTGKAALGRLRTALGRRGGRDA